MFIYPTHTDINKEHMIYNINNHAIWMPKHPVININQFQVKSEENNIYLIYSVYLYHFMVMFI